MTALGHILLVEDDRPTRRAIALQLESEGFTCHPVATGAEALAIAKSHRFDAAIVDFDLPDARGTDILLALHRSTRPLCGLVITGSRSGQTLRSILSIPACDFLYKPFNATVLARSTSSAVEATRLLQTRVAAVAPDTARQALIDPSTDATATSPDLTPREVEVGVLLVGGYQYDEIASILGMTSRTVRFHIHNMRKKTGTDSRASLLRQLRRHAVIKAAEPATNGR